MSSAAGCADGRAPNGCQEARKLSEQSAAFLAAFPGSEEYPFEHEAFVVVPRKDGLIATLSSAFGNGSPTALLVAVVGLLVFILFPLLLPALAGLYAFFAKREGVLATVAAWTCLCLLACAVLVLLRDEIAGPVRWLRGSSVNSSFPTTSVAGLHYANNPANQALLEHWPRESREYDSIRTRWLLTGDSRTLLPFVAFAAPELQTEVGQAYVRRWITVPKDDPTSPEVDDLSEAVAVDFAFPSGGHDPTKPIALVLHGLNGGSAEGYVKAQAALNLSRGITTAVFIARGMMNTPVRGGGIFNGARTCDFARVVEAIRKASNGAELVAIGFSMGAIVLANYVCKAGPDCPLAAAVAVSGGVRMTHNIGFAHSARLWQPFLAAELLRGTFARFRGKVVARLGQATFDAMRAAESVTRIDQGIVAPYNGFAGGVAEYYDRMSGFGSHSQGVDRVRGGAMQTALLLLTAEDDPLCHIATGGHPDEARRHPDGRIFMLVTARGGHVGWPVGPLPWRAGWSWMTTCALDFCGAALAARRSADAQRER